MTTDAITEKLAFHVKSFQESFDILSNSLSLEEMSVQFEKILRGSFFTTNVDIFHKKDDLSNWENIVSKNEINFKELINENEQSSFKIHAIKEAKELYSYTKLVDDSFLGIVLGKKIDNSKYSDIDKITFQIFIQLFDNAYQALLSHKTEKNLIFNLNNRVSQLYNLIDTGIEISNLNLGDKMLELALSRAISLTNSSFGRVKLSNEEEVIEEHTFPPNLLSEKKAKSNSLFEKFIDERTEYAFTLCEKESRQGIIEFDETDELLFGAIVRQVHAAIENERYHKEALENETMKRELAVASEIQKRILPEKLPKIEGYDLSGTNIPSKEVSGDYFQVFKLSDGRFALIVADVTGKGMPASLLVNTLDASLRSYLDFQIPLSEMAVKMNTIIYESSTADKFITFFIAVLNPLSGELDIINAGHNPALILRNNGKMEKIDAGGVAFGMFDMGLPFEGQKLILEKGERLFIFSDGIPEAMDKDEEEYSDEKMEQFFINKTPG
ncbi:MAG: SpoIIE family protein phosphatase, partial [Bacteroidota bacterium]